MSDVSHITSKVVMRFRGHASSHRTIDDDVDDDVDDDDDDVVAEEEAVGDGKEGNCCCLIMVQLGAKVAFTLIITD